MENAEETNNKMKHISAKQKSFIGMTKAGGDMLSVLFNGALLTFYIDELNMDPKLFGIVMIVFAVWNAINDPIFGYISDKRKLDSRGKRTFFIRLSLPIYLIGYLMFWMAFPDWSQASLFIFLLIALFIFDTGLTIYGLNLSAIQTSQTTDSNERTRIMVVASVISFLPLGLAAILPNMVFTSNLSLINIRLIFLGMAIIAAVFMFVGSFKMKEHTLEEEGVEPLPVWSAVKETFKSKSFIMFVIVNFMLVGVATNIVGVMPLYFKYVSQIDELTVLFVSIPIGVMQIPFYFLYGYLQRKIGIKYSAFIIVSVMLVGLVGLFFPIHIVFTTISYGLVLTMITFWYVIVNPMVGDIADEDEIKTGRRREGMFFGINALITKPSISLIIFFFTIIIDRFGFDSELDLQTAQAQLGIRIGISMLSLAFLVLAIVPLVLYPLYGKKIQKIKMVLQTKHEKLELDKCKN